jgi:hypothetical protein
MGNLSTLETEEMKRAMKSFIRAFRTAKGEIERVACDESPQSDYYYQVDLTLHDYNILPVLRFGESLRGLCLYWRMSLEEFGIFEEEVSSE